MTRDCPRDTPRRRLPPFGGRLCFRGRDSQARPAFEPASGKAAPAEPRAPCACYGANSAVGPWPIAGSARALRSWSPLRPPLSFEVLGPVIRLVSAVLVDVLELGRPMLGQEVESPLDRHHKN